MGVEARDDEGQAREPGTKALRRTRLELARRGSSPSRLAGAGLLLMLGCITQKPSSENAPSSAPAPADSAPVSPPPRAPLEPREDERQAPAAPEAVPSQESSEGAGDVAPPPASSPTLDPSARPRTRADGSHRVAPPTDAEQEDRLLRNRLRRRLDEAYRAGTPDCPSARDRKKAVCDLADQICQLIDRDPNVATVAHYCADAKERCAEAGRRTSQRCPD